MGYASDGQYARERLGMSRAAAWSRITFARRSQDLGPLADAVQDGRVGSGAAELLARVATTENVETWIDRAEERTYKLLHEEVQAVAMALRILGPERVDTAPPSGSGSRYLAGASLARETPALSGLLEREAPFLRHPKSAGVPRSARSDHE